MLKKKTVIILIFILNNIYKKSLYRSITESMILILIKIKKIKIKRIMIFILKTNTSSKDL